MTILDAVHTAMLENYTLASEELKQNSEHQSKHWEVMNNNYSSFLQTPEMWNNFRRNEISQGMDDANPHAQMIKPENMREHLEASYAQLKQNIRPDISCFASEPLIGNPQYHRIDGMNLSISSLDFTYFAWRIDAALGSARNAPLLFLEIGGGFGGLTRVLKLLYPNSKFILLDLPEGNATSSYFLQKQFPESKIFGLTNLRNGEKLDWALYDFAVLPGWSSVDIADQVVDFVINTRSMQEMRLETIAYYFAELQRLIKPEGIFYCVNRYIKKIGDEDIVLANYPYDDHWQFAFSGPKWNQGHIHEFISQRLNGPNPSYPYPELLNLAC